MISCKLADKTYFIDFVSGRALRELEPALKMYGKIATIAEKSVKGGDVTEEEKNMNLADSLDVMVKWFCILFNDQFTMEEVYNGYPADSLMQDIVVALLAVNSQTTNILSEFPMKAAQKEKKDN